ncbi:hypothetical protein, partial [Streptomyces sp. CBMA123]|uniref:hypothetical protein n=1 Tax=Streptomyces sp. CBMA123 TaxID=1896313 RepID=UPI001CB7F99B
MSDPPVNVDGADLPDRTPARLHTRTPAPPYDRPAVRPPTAREETPAVAPRTALAPDPHGPGGRLQPLDD